MHGLTLSAREVDLVGTAKAWVLPTGPQGAFFNLEGAIGTLVDKSFTYPRPADVWVIEGYPASEETYTDVHVSAGAWMEGSFLSVVPLVGQPAPQVSLRASGFTISPEAQACIPDPHSGSDTMPADCFDVGSAGNVTQVQGMVSVTLTGSFMVRMWGWEGPLASKEGPFHVWNGQSSEAFGTGVTIVTRTGMQDLRIQDGTMTVSLRQAEVGDLHISSAHAVAAGFVLDAAQGPTHLEGPVGAELTFPAGQVMLTPDPRASPTALAVTPLGDLRAWPWALAIAVVLMVGVSALIAWRRFRPSDPVLRALHRQDPARAARLAATQRPPRSPAEAAVRAVAFLQAGQYDLAERQLVAYALPAADHSFILACVRARQGRGDEARQLLGQAVALNAAYADEARLNADLQGLAPPVQGGPVGQGGQGGQGLGPAPRDPEGYT